MHINYYSACAGTTILCEQPTLMPPTLHVCPNEIVTYTCYDRQILAIDRIAEPYITAIDPIKYIASTAILERGSRPINRTEFYATLVKCNTIKYHYRTGRLDNKSQSNH